MSRTSTPTYRVEMFSTRYHYTPSAWNVRRDGRPTSENLTRHMDAFIESITTGVNRHLGSDPSLAFARVVDQRTGDTVATWEKGA